MDSKFKVKIIGGKLVHVPDFDYVREYGSNNLQQKHWNLPQRYGNLPQSNQPKISSRYQAKYLESNVHQRHDGRSYKDMSYVSRSLPNDARPGNAMSVGAYNTRGNLTQYSLNLDQRVNNQLEAERNKRRAQEQLYNSSLALDPVAADGNDVDDSIEAEVEDTALSKQVADCLQHTNKQKIAYALRAMKRLDTAGNGYITVREFRDVLLMYQIFIIGGALEKLIEKYKSNGGKINYTRLWNFVSSSFDSRDGLQNSTSSIAEESDEERKLREAKANIQKSLRVYAQKHKETFDFTEMEKSLQHCDRSGTRLMHENEMKIICGHYLPIDNQYLDALLKECDPQNNGWINYQLVLHSLKDAQPTYLPPLKHTRRGTYTIEDDDAIIPPPDLDNDRGKKNIEYNHRTALENGTRAKEHQDPNNLKANGNKFANNNNNNLSSNNNNLSENKNNNNNFSINKKNMDISNSSIQNRHLKGASERYETESPRRRWHESEESWRKRKRRGIVHEYHRETRKHRARKKWEHSAPVRSLRDADKEGSFMSDDWDDSEDA